MPLAHRNWRWHQGRSTYSTYEHRCSQVQDWQTAEWTTFHPQTAYLLQYTYGYLTQGHERNNGYVRLNPAATEIIRQGMGVYATRRLRPDTNTPWATKERGAHIHAYQPTMPCRLPHPENHNTIIFADASATTSLTPAAGRAALELEVDKPTAPTPAHGGYHFQGLLSRRTKDAGDRRGRRQ